MKSKAPKLAVMYVRNYGQIGAGRAVDNVIPFIPPSELVPIFVPESIASSSGDIGVSTVCGVSLENLGIFSGDYLIWKRAFTWREITPDRICIVYIHATGELVAKKVLRGANTLTLRASGGGIPDKEYSPDDIEIRAIVIGCQKQTDSSGRFATAPRPRRAV